MNKELEALKLNDELACNVAGIYSKYNGKQLGEILGSQDIQSIIDLVKQTLTPPTAEEIVKELNEWASSGIGAVSPTFKYKGGTFINNLKHTITLNMCGEMQVDINCLPLKLAHKITTFFMNRSDE